MSANNSPLPSRLSISSQLSDDLQVYSQPDLAYSYGPQENPFSDSGGSPRNSFSGPARGAASSSTYSKSRGTHGRTDSIGSNRTGGGKRSRARAFSFLLESASPDISYLSPRVGRSPNPNDAFTRRPSEPFGSPEYDDALAPAEDDGEDDDGIELNPIGKIESRRDAYRQTFQALTQQEYWWMGVSALCVLALTAGAIVVTIVG